LQKIDTQNGGLGYGEHFMNMQKTFQRYSVEATAPKALLKKAASAKRNHTVKMLLTIAKKIEIIKSYIFYRLSHAERHNHRERG